MTSHPISASQQASSGLGQLRRLFDHSPDVICLLDADGCFASVSAAGERLWGLAPEALAGRSLYSFVHPNDSAALQAAFTAGLAGLPIHPFVCRIRCADGTYAAFSWTASRDAAENRLYAIARPAGHEAGPLDAHQQQELLLRQQETEEELRRARERFRLVARTDAIYDWDILKDTLHWGEGLFRIFGYRPHELQMPQWEAALHPDEYDSLTASLHQTLEDGRSGTWLAEYRLRRPDGSWAYVEEKAGILRDREGRALRMVGRMEDISLRKQREAELQKLSLITQQTEDAIVVTDAEKRTTWINDAFTRLTGYTLADMQGRRPAAVLEGPAPDPALLERVDAHYRTKKPFTLEALNYRKDGAPFWSIISIQPVLDKDGNVLEYFSTRKDITERKLLEQELEQQRRRMTAAVIAAQEKERSDMSQELHDNVNQVLTTVKLYQELLLSGIGDPVELAGKSMRLLQESINEIRSISKRLSAPSLGKIRLHESVSELADAVAATRKVQVELDATAIADFDCPKDAHIALYRILQEQLTNVLKHAAATQVRVAFRLGSGRLTLEVQDNGTGFAPKERHGGNGLSNIRSRAQSLGGTVEVESAPGWGCRLVVRLPVANE